MLSICFRINKNIILYITVTNMVSMRRFGKTYLKIMLRNIKNKELRKIQSNLKIKAFLKLKNL